MHREIDYHTNGIATILQSPERAKVLVKATNVGTVVEQNANTDGWFHIPITTHTQIADIVGKAVTISSTSLESLYLSAKVNENAKIDRIHLRDGTKLIVDRDVNYIDTNVEASLYLSQKEQGHKLFAGLAMSIFVRFLTGEPRGRVEFRSAGARLRIVGP